MAAVQAALEDSYCTDGDGALITRCGNGALESEFETCDDGNREDGDGCDSLCNLEDGFTADADGQPKAQCGDSLIQGQETCDDDNTDNGDGCGFVVEGDGGVSPPMRRASRFTIATLMEAVTRGLVPQCRRWVR